MTSLVRRPSTVSSTTAGRLPCAFFSVGAGAVAGGLEKRIFCECNPCGGDIHVIVFVFRHVCLANPGTLFLVANHKLLDHQSDEGLGASMPSEKWLQTKLITCLVVVANHTRGRMLRIDTPQTKCVGEPRPTTETGSLTADRPVQILHNS